MKLNIKKLKKSAMYFVGTIIGIYVLVGLYSLIFEQDKLAIDRYNFEQLEKAKPILENTPINAKKFYTLKEFNEQYKADIKPIDNCYYVSNDNGKKGYIFGFQIKTLISKISHPFTFWYPYISDNYAYPKYSMSNYQICVGGRGCYDDNFDTFRYVISNPCKD